MTSKNGQLNSSSFNNNFVSFLGAGEGRYNNSFKNNGVHGVNDKNLPFNLLNQEDQRNASFMNNTEIFKFQQSQVFDHVAENQF